MYYVLYRSRFTGERCAMIVTRRSTNRKTGPMGQVWFLKLGEPPHRAVRRRRDRAVCGDCRLSGGRGCYVLCFQGPLSIYRALRAGHYKPLRNHRAAARRLFAGQKIRLGAYGDPASVPIGLLRELMAILRPAGWTGYTHSWRRAPWLRGLCMASCETLQDAGDARAKGWRTFRIRPAGGGLQTCEIVCVAESHKRKCIACCLCNGARDGVKSIVITAHGAGAAKVFAKEVA